MESVQISTEQIMTAVTQLSTSDLEQVFNHVLTVQAERKAKRLSETESSLLARINTGLPANLRERMAFLKSKREDHSINDDEYAELTQLSDRAEELHAKRLTALVELAKYRGVGLSELMNQLGIHFPEYV
jgi:hypothetical protein